MATQHAMSRSDANIEIRQFLRIIEELENPAFLEKLSQEAREYIGSKLVSFVFYKDQLDYLFSQVEANAYRVYFAAKETGRPTMVVVPCSINPDESVVENRISPITPPINQYPPPKSTLMTSINFDVVLDTWYQKQGL